MKRKIINPIIKDTITFIKTSEESSGAVTEMELTLMPNGNNFPHYHKQFSETFTVLEGSLGLTLQNSEKRILTKNESYTVAPLKAHSFYNPSNVEIKFNVKITPGHKGFEDSLRILYGLAEDGLTNKKGIPKSLTHIAIIGDLSDSNIAGFMKVLMPLLTFLLKRAKRNGDYAKLIQKYCY